MRLVLDTNVVVSALLWGGVPRLLLQAARERRVELFTSALLLAELTSPVRQMQPPLAGVMHRPWWVASKERISAAHDVENVAGFDRVG